MRALPSVLISRVAVLLVAGVAVLAAGAVLALPATAAGGLGLGGDSPPDDTGALPESGDVTGGGFLDDLSFSSPIVLGAISITVGAIAASIAFMGGTKFVNSQNVLENDARRTIFEHIRANPGAHLRATATALNLSTTNVLWHLRKLEGANLVASKKFEGYKLFYPVEGGLESRKRAIASSVVRNGNASQILEYILGRPAAHQREIARVLGVNHGTIRWHLRKLTEAGLVLQVRQDSVMNYYVSELGVQLLGEMGCEQAKAHASGAAVAPGAAVPASIAVPVSTAATAATASPVAPGGPLAASGAAVAPGIATVLPAKAASAAKALASGDDE